MLTLTKKSKKQLLNQFIGTGTIFTKTNETEFESTHFWLGNKGDWFVTGDNGKPEKLKDYLVKLANELKDRED